MNHSYLLPFAVLLVLVYKAYVHIQPTIHGLYAPSPSGPAVKGRVLSFNYSAANMVDQTRAFLAREKSLVDAIALEQFPTFNNVIIPLNTNKDTNEDSYNSNVAAFLYYVSPDKEIRDASAKVHMLLDEYYTDYTMRQDIYNLVHAVYTNETEINALSFVDKRLLDKMEQEFQRGGLMLSCEEQQELKSLNEQLSELEITFSKNLNEQVGKALFSREELNGIPEDYFNNRLVETEDGKTKYVVTTSYPDYFTLLTHATLESTRKQMFILFNSRCPENVELLTKAVHLRLRKAQLLGYKTFSEYALEPMMAKHPQAALDMLNTLREKLAIIAGRELDVIEKLKEADMAESGQNYHGTFSWDNDFYSNKHVEQKYNIDNNVLRQYFPLPLVTRGIFDIYQNMFGLNIVKVENPNVWHHDVEMYEVWDAHDSTFMGHFYLDLFPREGKYTHAACFPLRVESNNGNGAQEFPAVAMVANFPAPTSSQPSLLSHGDFKVFMHEFGHVVHGMCRKGKWSHLHAVEKDFVEAPSQMLENWVWDPATLFKIARHYKTNEPIPPELVQQLLDSKNKGTGLIHLNTVFKALFDLAIHNSIDIPSDINELYNNMSHDIGLHSGRNGTFGVASFSHLVIGYESRYYSYLWAESYSADMYYSRFYRDGVDNKQTGMEYRKEILQPGGARDSITSMEQFLGRKPNNDAYLKSMGL